MASLQARHQRSCPLAPWSTFARAIEGGSACTCRPTFYVRVAVGGVRSSERVGKNRREASRALAAAQAREDRGQYLAPQRLRFAEWADQWRAELEVKPTTLESYDSTLSYAKAHLGGRELRLIGGDEIKALDVWLRDTKGLSSSTRAKHLRVLGACFEAAVVRGHLARNPVGQIARQQRPRAKRRERGYFTNAEVLELLAAFPEGMYRAMVEVSLDPISAKPSTQSSKVSTSTIAAR